MKKLIMAICILTMIGCGSKKKITNVSKSYDLVIDTQKKTVEGRSDVKRSDTSKTKTTVSERNNERTIERYIFSEDGRLTEYSKETNKENNKKTDTDEKKGINVDSVGQRNESSVSDIKKETTAYQKDVDLKREGQNLIYWGIGIGIIILFIFFSLKLFLKR